MHIDTFIEGLIDICSKGEVGASKNRIRKIRALVSTFKNERRCPWYVKLALYFYKR